MSPVVLCCDELYANSTARPRLHLRSSASMRTPPLDGSGEGASPRPSTAEPEDAPPKSPRPFHQRPPETGVRHSLRCHAAPLGGGRPHWMSPPGWQGWEWRRCLPTTIDGIRRRAAPLGGGRPHWMSPPGWRGWECRRCLPATIVTRARLRAPPRPASVIRETLRSWASAPDVAPRTLRS